MMNRPAIAALFLSALSFPAQAALSGFYDSGEQVKAILDSPEVANALRQAPVKSIEQEGIRSDGTIEWEIETKDCELTVYLRPVPPAGVGKTTYVVAIKDGCW